MFDLTVLDYIYIGIVFFSTIWATVRGGVYETVATLSWIVAAVTARFVSPSLDTVFMGWFGATESTVGTLLASYFVIFFVILIVFGFFNHKLRDKIQQSMMKITDHTLGVIFGIVRGIVLMGLIYWAALWYYSDRNTLPQFISASRTRPIMQLTAVKIHDWFIPGENKLLERDMTGAIESEKIYNNLINPAIKSSDDISIEDTDSGEIDSEQKSDAAKKVETGYKSSERSALENQLLQIETTAKAEEASNQKLYTE